MRKMCKTQREERVVIDGDGQIQNIKWKLLQKCTLVLLSFYVIKPSVLQQEIISLCSSVSALKQAADWNGPGR